MDGLEAYYRSVKFCVKCVFGEVQWQILTSDMPILYLNALEDPYLDTYVKS